LPFGFSQYWKVSEQLKITNTFTSGISKNLMPVFADHGSTVSPLMLLSGKRGQLFFFDNYLSLENFNIVVVGAPGKGKSTFLSEYTLSTLRLGGQVVTLDDGKSAKNLCRQLKGEHTEFTGTGFCINPFSFYMKEGDPNLGRIEDYKADFEVPFLAMIRSMLCIIMEIDVTKKSPINAVYKTVMDNASEKVMKEKGRDGGFYDI
jgi:conjugal transfer ATP-binding protein TraC